MNTVQASRTATSIFIGRWTPKVLFSLRQRPYRHGRLRRNWEAFHNECSVELFAIWNPRV
jgi:DNA-binding HxlR family transcriptional regulator